MANLESTVKQINDTVIEINANVKNLASKSYVLGIFGATAGVAVLSFIGHMLLRGL